MASRLKRRDEPNYAPAVRPSAAHRLEFAAVYVALKLFRRIGPGRASNLGGGIARAIGPLIPVSNIANRNLAAAMPELSKRQRRRIVADTWENLGRTAAELAHIGRLRETASGPGYRITGAEHLDQAVRAGGPNLILTGHVGNWEIIPGAVFARGMDLAFMYRAASNPLVDALILKLREEDAGRKVTMFAKGAAGARGAYAHLVRHGDLGMLVDQKLNNGIAVPFFGMPAMTAPALAAFALKFRCADHSHPCGAGRAGAAACDLRAAADPARYRRQASRRADPDDHRQYNPGRLDPRGARLLVMAAPTLAERGYCISRAGGRLMAILCAPVLTYWSTLRSGARRSPPADSPARLLQQPLLI